MGDTRITDIIHFLDENVHIAPKPGFARRLADHLKTIVAMVSQPELLIPAKHRVRRQPERKPHPGMIKLDLEGIK